jgi:hypothetical protein
MARFLYAWLPLSSENNGFTKFLANPSVQTPDLGVIIENTHEILSSRCHPQN